MTTSVTRATRLLREGEAAAILGLKVRTLQRWRLEQRGPKTVKVGAKAVRYPENALFDYISELTATAN